MFQNIIDEEINENNSQDTEKKISRKINFKNLFSVSDFILYAVSFMISMVSGFRRVCTIWTCYIRKRM